METSTKIIIGSSITIVGIATVYLIMSRKKSASSGELPTSAPIGSTPIGNLASGELPVTVAAPVAVGSDRVATMADVTKVTANGCPPGKMWMMGRCVEQVQLANGDAQPGYSASAIPASGKLLRNFCDGVKSMGEYADGMGGTIVKVINDKAPACGYIPPSTDFSDSNDYPEVTAMLINELRRLPGLQATLRKWWEEEMKFKNPNFDSTAPQHGGKSLYQYTIQEMFRHAYGNRRCSINRDMNDFLIDKRGAQSGNSDFNDWGRSVVNNKDHFNCDYKTEKLTLAFINARDVAKANSAGVYARKLATDLMSAYNEMFTI